MSNATLNGNGKAVETVTDSKTIMEASAAEAKRLKMEEKRLEAERKKQAILESEQAKKAAESWEELDYAAVDSINQAMLIMVGERVDHSENVKGLCAIGRVELQVGEKRLTLGTMTKETLKIDPVTMSFLFECGFSSEQILEVAADAKKAWCLGDKVTKAKDKDTRDRAKKQSKIDRQKAILDKLKNGK
jgi:hypothetical protein